LPESWDFVILRFVTVGPAFLFSNLKRHFIALAYIVEPISA
jgi:hypothetical protein